MGTGTPRAGLAPAAVSEERALAWMEASHRLTAALGAALSQTEVARAVFEKGMSVFGADAGALAVVPADAPDQLELVESFGYPAPLVETWRRFPLALRSPVTDAARLQAAQWVDSPAEARARYPEWAPAVAAQRDRSWAALPLVARGRALGALGLSYHAERAFDDETRRLLQSLADRCALALDRARVLDEAREHRDRLVLAKDAAGLGIYDLDVATGRIAWDDRLRALWGYGPDEPATYDRLLAGIHPDDRDATAEAARRALDPGGAGVFRAEHRVRGRDGVERWIAATGQVTFAHGAPVRLVGTVQDVTSRRRAEDELRASEGRSREAARLLEASQERLALALAAGNVGIWEWDLRSGRGWWSPETHAIMGVPLDRFSGAPEAFYALVHPDDRPGVEAQMEESLARDVPFTREYRIQRPDGATRWVANIARVVRDAAGAPLRVVGTVRDVSEEHAADQRRSDFLAVLSHELRNPLAPIGNALALLDRAPPGSDLDQRARAVLRRQTRHLGRLVDDLLDVARITHGKIDLRLARLDAREVARRACDDVRAVFEERGVALRCAQGPEPAWVEADPARLAQMIGNLLSNALKFTGAGGRVEVRVALGPSTCRIAVQDTGAGIAADDLPRVFAPFMQAERTRARSQNGLGIGLALVQDLALRHRGTVTAASAGVGRGAEFTLELPRAAAPARRDPPAPAGEAHGRPLDILVAEDNEDAGATLAELLRLLGHSARRVSTGNDAIREAARAPPQVLLCDVGLPDVSGHDVIRSVRAQERGGEIFAVALTGYAQPHDRTEALRAGFDAHVPKPPALEELERLLREAGRRGHASRA